MNITLVDGKIKTTPAMSEFVTREITGALGRFESIIADVRVVLEDLNARKGGVDKKCGVQVRMTTGKVLLAEDEHADYYGAIRVTVNKIKLNVEREHERLVSH
jgi:putative sigma-54 modulation protein